MSGAVVGLCLAMGYQFQTAGLRLTTPSKSAFITGLVVVLVPLLSGSATALRRRAIPRWNAYLGALTAFAGIVLLTTPAGAGFDFTSVNRGDLLTLGCALGRGCMFWRPQCLACLIRSRRCCRLILRSVYGRDRAVAGTSAHSLDAAAGLSPAVRLCWLRRRLHGAVWAQQFLPATHTALILALEPVFAWITSFAILGERLSFRASGGALLILAGIGLTEFLPNRMQPTAHETVPLN